MTHAAKSHDAFEALIEMRERLEAVIKSEEERQSALEREQAEIHARIALANAARLLAKISRQSRLSDRDRQAAGVLANQLSDVAA